VPHRLAVLPLYDRSLPLSGVHMNGAGQDFATRMQNVFVIGKTDKPLVSLPKGKGIKLNILQEAAKAKASA